MMSTSPQDQGKRRHAPREISYISSGPDPLSTAVSNAVYVLDELTSRRRLSTLAALPTRDQILRSIDAILEWRKVRHGKIEECALALRVVCEHWTPTLEAPPEILGAARALMLAMGASEPPLGWEGYDGYPETWGSLYSHPQTAGDGPAVGGESAPRAAGEAAVEDASFRAARVAQAYMNFINLCAALAAPRIWGALSQRPLQVHLVEHADAFLSGLEAMTGQEHLKGPGATLRALLSEWAPGPEVPAEIALAARSLLVLSGVAAPAADWESIEPPGSEER